MKVGLSTCLVEGPDGFQGHISIKATQNGRQLLPESRKSGSRIHYFPVGVRVLELHQNRAINNHNPPHATV